MLLELLFAQFLLYCSINSNTPSNFQWPVYDYLLIPFCTLEHQLPMSFFCSWLLSLSRTTSPFFIYLSIYSQPTSWPSFFSFPLKLSSQRLAIYFISLASLNGHFEHLVLTLGSYLNSTQSFWTVTITGICYYKFIILDSLFWAIDHWSSIVGP